MNIDRLDWIEQLSRCEVPEERREVERKWRETTKEENEPKREAKSR